MESNRIFEGYPGYILTSPFGMRVHPISGTRKMHNGIDLVATADGKTGQVAKIKAHTGGVVDGVGFDPDAGNFVRIKVDADTKMYYFHLQDMSPLTAGEEVRAGDIIGVMGMTGNVTGKHLHWGIKKNGQWIDPAPYLDADYPAAKEPEPQAPAQKDIIFTLTVRVLRRGCKGEDVKALQRYLRGCGYTIDVDGSFGPATENTVECYQEDTDGVLAVDGVAGPATQRYMHGQGGG